MPADKNDTDTSSDNGGENEQGRVSALIRAIRMEMETMTPEELERLYGVVVLMRNKNDE